jgi:hypothetical protein
MTPLACPFLLPRHAVGVEANLARSSTATIAGHRPVVNNVRDFIWRSDTDFDQRWEQRSYSLSQVTDVDLIMSY